MTHHALRSILFMSCITMFSASLGACVDPDGGDDVVADDASALAGERGAQGGGEAPTGDAPMGDGAERPERGERPGPGGEPPAGPEDEEPVADNEPPAEEPVDDGRPPRPGDDPMGGGEEPGGDDGMAGGEEPGGEEPGGEEPGGEEPGGDDGMPDTGAVALELPDVPYNYARPNYPQHFLADNGPGGPGGPGPGGPGNLLDLDSAPANNPVTDAGATLGRVLFYDVNLSQNRTTACASCHQPQFGFSDDQQFSFGFEGELTGRNSMGLANARFNANGRYFWDERAATLEEQVLGPIQDQVEMGLTLAQLEQRVEEQPYYASLFEDAFGDDAVSSQRISLALAQFVRSMVSATTRYDEGRAQVPNQVADFPNLTAQENRGKEIFFGPAGAGGGGCGACHGTEAFIGLRPTNNGLDANTSDDEGIGGSNGVANQEGMFRAPSLRNIELTGPFMHDGRLPTLESVVAFYNNGVQPHRNLSPPLRGRNGQPVRLGLSQADQTALVAFLRTLTDDEMNNDPKFSDPFIRD